MPPRRNTARRGRKTGTMTRCAAAPADKHTAAEQMESRLPAAIVVVEKLSEPMSAAGESASHCRARKSEPCGAAFAAAEPAELEEAPDKSGGGATDEEAEEDSAFEALVLDADDDEGASPGTLEDQKEDDYQGGEEEEDFTHADEEEADREGDEHADVAGEGSEMNVEDVEQEGRVHAERAENANGKEYAEVDEEGADELHDGDEEDEGVEEWDGEVDVADEEAEEGAEDEVEYEDGAEYEEWDGDDAQVVDDVDDAEGIEGGETEDVEAAEAEPEDEQDDTGGADAEYTEQESKDGAEHDDQESKDGVIASSAGDDAAAGDTCEHAAGGEFQNADADDNTAGSSEVCVCEQEDEQEGGTMMGKTSNGEMQGDTASLVADRDTAAGDFSAGHAFTMMKEGAGEPMVEVTQLADLCPVVALEQPGSIPVSFRDSIQHSVHRFIERLLRDAREVGASAVNMGVVSQDGKKAVFGCNLCNIEMEQPEHFDYHVESPQHVKRLRWMYFMGLNKELSQLNCRVCHISMPCREHLTGHLRSERHVCLSKALNVHPAYSEYLLLQHFSRAEVQSMLQSQQWPTAARSQQAVADKGKHSKGKKQRSRHQEPTQQGQQKQELGDVPAEADGSSQATSDATKASPSSTKGDGKKEVQKDEEDQFHSKGHRPSRDRLRSMRRDRSISREARRSSHAGLRDDASSRASGRSSSRNVASRRHAGRGMSWDTYRDHSRAARGDHKSSSKGEAKASDLTSKDATPSAGEANQREDGSKAEDQNESKVGVMEDSGDSVAKWDTKADSGDTAAEGMKDEPKKSDAEGGEGKKAKGDKDSKEKPKGDTSMDRSRTRHRHSRSRSRSRTHSRGHGVRTGPRRGRSPRDPPRDLKRHTHRDSPPQLRRRPPELHSETSRGSRRSRSSSRGRGPRGSPPALSSFKCYTCNLSFYSTREYNEHFASRSHRLATSLRGGLPSTRKRSRSPSPLSRPLRRSPRRSPPHRSPHRSPRRMSPHHHHHHHHSPRRSPRRSRSPLRSEQHWSGAGHPRKRSPDMFGNHASRDLMTQQAAAVFPAGLTASQAGLLEEYTERRSGAVAPTASTVAATLETMIQLQQRLLSITAAQQQQQVSAASLAAGLPSNPALGGVAAGTTSTYRGDEFASQGLQEMDLQKSLQQLRQSQRYNVGSTVAYGSGSGAGGQQSQHVQAHQAATQYASSSAQPLRSAGASYQSSTMDAYSKKGTPYTGGAGSYSQTGGQPGSSAYSSSGAYSGSSALGGGGSSITNTGVRTNEYRKSSLGPTAPLPTTYGRPTLGHLGRATGGSGVKRF